MVRDRSFDQKHQQRQSSRNGRTTQKINQSVWEEQEKSIRKRNFLAAEGRIRFIPWSIRGVFTEALGIQLKKIYRISRQWHVSNRTKSDPANY